MINYQTYWYHTNMIWYKTLILYILLSDMNDTKLMFKVQWYDKISLLFTLDD